MELRGGSEDKLLHAREANPKETLELDYIYVNETVVPIYPTGVGGRKNNTSPVLTSTK